MFSLLSSIALFVPQAMAQTPADGIDTAGGALAGGSGTFGSVLLDVATTFGPIVTAGTVLALTIIGFFLTVTGSEGQQSTAKRMVIAGLTAVVLLNLAIIIATSYVNIVDAPGSAAALIIEEARGLVNFLEFPLGVACVVMIVVSGIRAIASFGQEDGIAQIKRTILFVVAGFLLVYTRRTLADPLVEGSPSGIMIVIIGIIDRIIQFLALIALAMIVYAAILMIANIGQEDQYSKAKSLIIRVGIGIIVIFSSLAIVRLMLSAVV